MAAERVHLHVERFNAAVTRGEWPEFVDSFAPDAVMSFDGVPVGPFAGRDAIAAGYAAQPPTDTMSVVSVHTLGAVDVVGFAWKAGGGGTMRIEWHDDAVALLTISFGQTAN